MFNTITYQKKIIGIIVLVIIIILIAIKYLIYPIFIKNSNLVAQISKEQSLYNYLEKSKKIIKSKKIFPKLNISLAKNIIKQNFNNIAKSIIIKNGSIVLNAKAQNFNNIIKNISNLKNNNGIVVIKANLVKQKEGLVNINLVFKYL